MAKIMSCFALSSCFSSLFFFSPFWDHFSFDLTFLSLNVHESSFALLMLFSDFLKNIITQCDNFKVVERKKETLEMLQNLGGRGTENTGQKLGERRGYHQLCLPVLGDIWLLEHWLVIGEDPRMRLEGGPKAGLRAAWKACE